MVDEDLLATATLIRIVSASVNLEGEVPEQWIACMLNSAPLEIVAATDADHIVGKRVAEKVRAASCWQGRSFTRTG